jgi:hypothetical protein
MHVKMKLGYFLPESVFLNLAGVESWAIRC